MHGQLEYVMMIATGNFYHQELARKLYKMSDQGLVNSSDIEKVLGIPREVCVFTVPIL